MGIFQRGYTEADSRLEKEMIRRPWLAHAVSTASPKSADAELIISSGARYPVAAKNRAAANQKTDVSISKRASGGTQRSSASAIREKSLAFNPWKNTLGASLNMMPR